MKFVRIFIVLFLIFAFEAGGIRNVSYADSAAACLPPDVFSNLTRGHSDGAYQPGGPPEMALFAVVPKDQDEYFKVFGHRPSVGELANVRRAQKELPLAVKNTRFASREGGAREFELMLKQSPAQVIAVTGHNSRGVFRFVDSQISLQDLAGMCRQFQKTCIFLSCSSEKYVSGFVTVPSKISYDDAASIAKALSSHLAVMSNKQDPDSQTIVSELQNVIFRLNEQKNRNYAVEPLTVQQVIAGSTITSFVVVGAVVYYCHGRINKSGQCSPLLAGNE